MNRSAIALAVLAGSLVLVILAEILAPGLPGREAALEPAAPDAATDLSRGAGDPVGKTVAEILSRPLFRGDRRPAPADGRTNGTNPPGDMPRLSGILISSEANRAIFQPAGKGRAIVVLEGETVGNWRVQTIAADAVTLTGPGGTRRLEPKFSGNPGSAGVQQTPPAPASGGPLFGQQTGGMDRPQGKH